MNDPRATMQIPGYPPSTPEACQQVLDSTKIMPPGTFIGSHATIGVGIGAGVPPPCMIDEHANLGTHDHAQHNPEIKIEENKPVPPPTLAVTEPELKLDLACGQNVQPGFKGVDIAGDKADIKCNLMRFPWPWKDNSVSEIFCSHFIEHIPMLYVGPDGKSYSVIPDSSVDKDLLFAFFDECWRILKKTKDPQKPSGKMTIICPCARSNRAFQDPTHRRFIMAETFFYFNRDWRVMNKLDHYNVKCHYGLNIVPAIPKELEVLHPEAQARRFNENWNTVMDWKADLIAVE